MENIQPISLDTLQPEERIRLDDTPTVTVPTPEVTSERAFKASYGVTLADKSYNDIYNEIAQGREANLRQHMASTVDLQRKLKVQKLVQEIAAKTGKPLTGQDAALIQETAATLQRNSDPNTVIEDQYAERVIEAMNNVSFSKDSVLTQARKENPKLTEDILVAGKLAKAQQELILRELQDAQSEKKAQSWPGFLFDQSLLLSQVYQEYQLRGRTKGVGTFEGGFLGSNLEVQAQKYLSLPYSEFKVQFPAAMKALREQNPSLAMLFGQAVLGRTQTEEFTDNVMTSLIGTAGFTAASIIKSARSARQVAKALDTVLKDTSPPSKAAITESVGDTSEAAIQQAATKIEKINRGVADPIADVHEQMVGMFKGEAKAIGTDPGPFRQDFVNRLEESYMAPVHGFLDKLAKLAKVERIPNVLKIEAAMKAIEKEMLDSYPGLKNNAIAMGKPYKDPLLDLYYVDLHFGQQGGKLWDEKGAKQFASDHFPGAEVVSKETTFTPELKPITFKTSKGSTYTVDGTGTVRDKKVGGAGIQPKSDQTIYIKTADDLDFRKIQANNKQWRYTVGEDGVHLWTKQGENWKIVKYAPFEKVPAKGLRPLELWYPKKGGMDLGKLKASSTVHFGNEIVDVKGLDQVITEQKGLRWSVKITKAFPETGDAVKDYLVHTNESKTPESNITAFGGWLGSLRTPDEVLSFEQRFNRKIATYAPSQLTRIIKEQVKEIKELKGWRLPFTSNKAKWTEWENTIQEISTTLRDPRDGSANYLPRSVGEFSGHFNRISKRLPDEQETKAYFAYKRLTETKDFLEKRIVYKGWARQGAETWTLSALNPSLARFGKVPSVSTQVHAIKETGYPSHADSMLVVGRDVGFERFVDSGRFRSTTAGKDVVKRIEDGRMVALRIVNPEDYPLKDFWGKGQAPVGFRPRYVVVPTELASSKALSWNDIKIRQTADTEYDFYIKQARIALDSVTNSHWYLGDATIGAYNIRKMGKDVAERLDQMRQLIKADRIDEAKEVNPLPIDFETVHGWFKPEVTAEGLNIPSKFSLEERIRLVPRNTLIHDLDRDLAEKYKNTFKNGTKESFRDPIDNTPAYKSEPTRVVSPITLINRGLRQAIESTYLHDYKTFSVEHWVEEAAKFLDVPKESLRQAPYFYFHNPVWKEGSDPAYDITRINNLKTARFQIQQFVGVEDQTQTFVHSIAQRLADSVYTKYGAEAALVPGHLLPKLRDPFSFMRSVTFHLKVGALTIPQLLVQANTFSAIYGIAGVQFAGPGTRAMLLDSLSGVNRFPEILDHLDKMASTGHIPGTKGFKPGWFTEARTIGESTGLFNVGSEHILRNSTMSFDVFTNNGRTILDAASFFFRESERAVRKGAWYTAYLEFRHKRPTGKLSDQDIAEILERADTLSVNMSKASASTLHRGVLSIPTQFYTYALRTTELFTGKRLTEAEKARWVATNMALYGVPAGSLGLLGMPIADNFQAKAKEEGYIVGESWIKDLFYQGGLAQMLAIIAGNHYNVAERYANNGLTFISDAMKADKAILSVVTGATGTMLYNTFVENLGPFYQAIGSMTRQEGMFKLKPDHYVSALKEFSALSNTDRFITALNTGRWLSRSGEYLSDVTAKDALFRYVTGLDSSESADTHHYGWTRKAEKDLMDTRSRQAVQEFRRGLRSSDNPEQAADYFRNAIVILESAGYPIEDYDKFFATATRDHESLVDRMNWQYFNEKVPEYRRDKAFDTFVRKLQLMKQRNTQ